MAVKVLVVDDSGFFRRRVSEILSSDPNIQVVGTATNGREAIDQVLALKPDVITMDYEMPMMDGITAVRNIMQRCPTPVLMFSSLTHEGARVTLDALDAGAVAIAVPISPWLLLITLLLAMFLALCKRRQEFLLVNDAGTETRPSLLGYNERMLDQLIAMTGASVIVCYALYTQWPDTVEKFGSHRLGFTLPLVMFGIFRYINLVYHYQQGERPEQVLLTDRPLLITVGLYALATAVILGL